MIFTEERRKTGEHFDKRVNQPILPKKYEETEEQDGEKPGKLHF